MRWLLIFLTCLLALGCAPGEPSSAQRLSAVRVCGLGETLTSAPPPDASCPPGRLADADPQGRLLLIQARVTFSSAPEAGSTYGVRIAALAASAVYWNGRLVGRNGRPAARAADEVPGKVEATFPLAADVIRPGDNKLAVLISSHRAGLRFRQPIQGFGVVQATPRPTLGYAPALVALGVLGVGAVYFGTLWRLERRDRASLMLAGASLAAAGQLVAEVSRELAPYPYPLHALRVVAITGFAALFGVLLVAFCATRFPQRWSRSTIILAVGAAIAAALLTPGFDGKALAVLVTTSSIAALLAGSAWRAGQAGAGPALAGLALFPALVLLSGRLFLDQTFYVALVLLALLLSASQGLAIRREQQDREAARRRAAALELEALKRQLRQLVVHRNGRREVVDLSEVVSIRGADDYSELVLADGGTRLLSESLASLADRLPDSFLRVHRSAIVNLERVRELARRAGGGLELVLAGGAVVPVGRTYAKAVRAAVEAPLARG